MHPTARAEDVALTLREIAGYVGDDPDGAKMGMLLMQAARQLGEMSGFLAGKLRGYEAGIVDGDGLADAIRHATNREQL